MNTYPSRSGASSAMASVSDLDGYSFQDDMNIYSNSDKYLTSNATDFGFDPPDLDYSKADSDYSPANGSDMELLSNWPGYGHCEDARDQVRGIKAVKQENGQSASFQMNHMMATNLPNSVAAVSRYGQVTPPRSDSSPSSVNMTKEIAEALPKAALGRGKRTKTQIKAESSSNVSGSAITRKRKSTRKSAVSAMEDDTSPEDDKRKMSLEKNRVAAAKCRVNKKEKTDQLQRDSHDKAVENTFLKQTIMNMREEIQQMHSMLMSHSNSDGCRKPHEIHSALSAIGQDLYTQDLTEQSFENFAEMHGQDTDVHMQPTAQVEEDYFQARSLHTSAAMLHNPPLPEFKMTGDFEVRTPLIND